MLAAPDLRASHGAGGEPDSPEARGGLELDEDELELSAEDLEPFDPEEDLRGDARALIRAREPGSFTGERALLTEDELEADVRADAQALLSGKGPEPGDAPAAPHRRGARGRHPGRTPGRSSPGRARTPTSTVR